MTFQEVSPQATRITMLKLRFFVGNEWYDARFRDVPLVKIGAH
jgi:hypothetical protein